MQDFDVSYGHLSGIVELNILFSNIIKYFPNISIGFGTDFEITHGLLTCQSLSLLFGDLSFVLEVSFIAHKDHDDFLPATVKDQVDPLPDIFEWLAIWL